MSTLFKTSSTPPFKLDSGYINKFSTIKPDFGYNGLGEFTYRRTYSRLKDNTKNEQWFETVERVVNGTYNIMKKHIELNNLGWNNSQAQESAEEMYRLIFEMKFLPPGRGLWAMGSELTEKRNLYAALSNCAFVSTENIENEPIEPFTFLMDASMLGVGVGFDTKGAGRLVIKGPNISDVSIFEIPDTREGWVDSLRLLLLSHFDGTDQINFDYSLIRPAGAAIKGFGGVASGPVPLKEMLEVIDEILTKSRGLTITIRNIVDIMNLIGKCVVSGNVRRCIPKNSFVHTRRGLIRIQDVEIGQSVLTSKGYKKVVNNFHQGKQETIVIKTQDGHFKCTANHRMAVFDSVENEETTCPHYEWKEASKLKQGDRLISCRKAIPGSNTVLPSCKDITIPELDTGMCWLIGLFHGNDYTYNNYQQNEFNASIQLHVAEKAKAQLQRFGENLHIILRITNDENCYIVHCQSKQLASYMYEIIKQSIIPDFILQSTINNRKAYLAGVLDSDRCPGHSPVQVVSTVYPKFAEQIQCLLYSVGIESRLDRENQELTSKVNLITMRTVKLFNEFPELLKTLCIGDKEIDDDCDLCPVEVISIKEGKKLDTYDIEVEDSHEFFCNGYLTHNSSEISFGDPTSKEFMDLKDYKKNPERQAFGWNSNNSIFANIGMDYTEVVKRIAINGEPGLAWLENMQSYSRMIDPIDNKDHKVKGGNPCLEQSLESFELCCLVESFPFRHSTKEEYIRTLKFAYLYAKTVTLCNTHWPKTNRVLMRNRRIGCSISGISQMIAKHGVHVTRQWFLEGYQQIQKYDKIYSDWLCIPRSIKTTSIKPSGTVSLLAGATPGLHFPESRFYIRRVRFAFNSTLLPIYIAAGYYVEDDVFNPSVTKIISFPIDEGAGIRCKKDVSMWEQLLITSMLQEVWSDNQVSATITFNPVTEGKDIANALDYFQYKLKGISFLPLLEEGAYQQTPYEEITEEKYNEMMSKINTKNVLSSIVLQEDEMITEKFCDGGSCSIAK